VNPYFKYEILSEPGGETLKYCFQCGTCTASCPIIRAAGSSFEVRKILRMTNLGFKDRVLSSEVLWFCAACHTCVERCPQGVEIAEVLTILRNLAVKNGYFPETLKTMASNIIKFGFAFEIGEDEELLRDMLGLPSFLKANIKDVSKIAKETGLTKICKIDEGVP
jgi:heterodisulfide reductase subunit C